MLNTTFFLILDGRFEAVDDPIPYTLQRQDEATIDDYNVIAKKHLSKVKTCYVIPRPSRTLRSNSGPPTDHNPIVLHLSLPAKSDMPVLSTNATTSELPHAPNSSHPNSKTLQFGMFSDALEDQATIAQPVIREMKTSLQHGTINPTQYSENVNTIIFSALQFTAHKILGTTAFRGKNAQKEHMTHRGHQDNGQYSSNDKRKAAKQTSTQTLKDKL